MPATNVKTNAMGFPYPLGKVYPAASFATLCVALTQNVVPVNNDGTTPDYQFNGIFIQADPDNEDTIYVCSTADAPDATAFTNVLAKLSPGAWFPRTKEWANNRDIRRLFIGAKNATDSAIVTIDQF